MILACSRGGPDNFLPKQIGGGVKKKTEQMDGKRFKYISAISLLTVWGALGPWLERTGACWLVQQAP